MNIWWTSSGQPKTIFQKQSILRCQEPKQSDFRYRCSFKLTALRIQFFISEFTQQSVNKLDEPSYHIHKWVNVRWAFLKTENCSENVSLSQNQIEKVFSHFGNQLTNEQRSAISKPYTSKQLNFRPAIAKTKINSEKMAWLLTMSSLCKSTLDTILSEKLSLMQNHIQKDSFTFPPSIWRLLYMLERVYNPHLKTSRRYLQAVENNKMLPRNCQRMT